jgi:hypothetical protein
MSANHSMFGRYMLTFDKQLPSWPDSKNVLTTRPQDTAQKHTAHSLTVGDTRVFGSNAVNSVRVAWNQTNSHYHLEPFFGPETIGVKNFYNYVPGVMALAVKRVHDRVGRSVYFRRIPMCGGMDNFRVVPGRHRLAIGTEDRLLEALRPMGSAARPWTFEDR